MWKTTPRIQCKLVFFVLVTHLLSWYYSFFLVCLLYLLYSFSQYIVSLYYIRRPCASTLSGHPSSSFPCVFFVFLVLYSVPRFLLHPFLFFCHAPSFTHNFFATQHLSHTTCHTAPFTRIFFVNHHLFHTQLCHAPYIYLSFLSTTIFHTPSFFHVAGVAHVWWHDEADFFFLPDAQRDCFFHPMGPFF